MTRYAQVDLAAIFGPDEYADHLRDQADALAAEDDETEEGGAVNTVTIVTPLDHAVVVDGQVMPEGYDPFAAFANALADRIERDPDPEPEPPATAKVVPLWVGLLAKADGRRGVDSRESRQARRASAIRRCA